MLPPAGHPNVLVLTGGHPYVADAFFAVFDTITPGRWTHLAQPGAAEKLTVEGCAPYDAIVFYDLPGLRFTRSDPPAEMPEPSPSVKAGIHELLEAGKGLVFMHHAVAGWPAWPEYASIIGGRYHYQPAELAGVHYPDSGYRFDITHEIEVLDPTHPICAGLGSSFMLTDELYMFPVLESQVVPLLRTCFPMDDASQFYSTDLAIRGTRNSNEGWTHPAGSDLVGWVKNAGNSPVAYLQFGDGPVTYADPNFQRVLSNAINWAASTVAHDWARTRNTAASSGQTT